MLTLSLDEKIAQGINVVAKALRQLAPNGTCLGDDRIFEKIHTAINSSGVQTSGGSRIRYRIGTACLVNRDLPMRTIVAATDCSELSRRTLRYADVLAKATGAAVVAVYGGAFSARLEGEGVAAALASRDDAESMMEPVRRCVEEVVEASLSPDVERDIVIADARPADAIVETAHRRDADLIVMGTHDRNRIVRAFLGSVTDTVLHHTRRPVLILREHTRDQPIRRILCPFRDTPASAAAVGRAMSIASAFDAEILFANAVDDHTIPDGIAKQIAGCPKCEICHFTVTSDAGERIVRLAAERNVDLIVLGTRHRRFSDPSVVGMPSSHIVRMAHCPVLAVTA